MLCQLANEWGRLGHQVEFVAPAAAGLPYYETSARVHLVDASGREVPPASPTAGGATHVLHALRCVRSGLKRVAADADVVLANHSVTSWPVALCRTRARKFVYIQAYEAEDYAGTGRWSHKVMALAAYLSYYLPLQQIVNSPTYIGYRNLSARDWVPAGVDLALMRPGADPAPLGGRPVVMGCLGRVEPFKGTEHVIRAYEILRERGVDAHLRVAHGNLPPGRAVPEGCEVVPASNDGELVAFYQSLDVLVAPPTIHLGAPHCPVMEAMACRVAVVTTGAIPASEGADNCWIVPPHRPDAIADAIQDIVSNEPRRRARLDRAFQDIQAFSWTVLAPQMLAIFTGTPPPELAARQRA